MVTMTRKGIKSEEIFDKWAEKEGYTIIKNGFPDRILFKDDIGYIFVEVKRPYGKFKPTQLETFPILKDFGLDLRVFRISKNDYKKGKIIDSTLVGWDEVKKLLDSGYKFGEIKPPYKISERGKKVLSDTLKQRWKNDRKTMLSYVRNRPPNKVKIK